MNTTQIIIKFNDLSCLKKDVYQVILKDLNQQIFGLYDDAKLLMELRAKLKDALALVENRHFKVTHPDLADMPKPEAETLPY